jgi:hypothetical protein
MKTKRASVAKVVALAVVPPSLMVVLVNVTRQHKAKAATHELLSEFGGSGKLRLTTDPARPALDALISQGADVNARTHYGRPILHFFHTTAEIAVLLDHGADANAQDREGRTALMNAVESGNSEVVRLLLRRGANVNLRATGSNALHTALAMAQDALNVLVNDPTVEAPKDEISRLREIIQMLKAAGAKE